MKDKSDKLSKDLMKNQKGCMMQLMKFKAGMACLACDANADKFVKKNTDGTSTVTVSMDTCKRM